MIKLSVSEQQQKNGRRTEKEDKNGRGKRFAAGIMEWGRYTQVQDDANEYKNYLLGIVFYKYLSDSFLIKAYDLLYDEKPETMKAALEAYKGVLEE